MVICRIIELINLGKFGPHSRVVELFSCLARDLELYVVVNMGSKRLKAGKEMHYNTDVTFNRSGHIVATYDKRNLFTTEKEVFDTPKLEITTFETEFGTFGLITCFDAMFEHPLIDLVDDKGSKKLDKNV